MEEISDLSRSHNKSVAEWRIELKRPDFQSNLLYRKSLQRKETLFPEPSCTITSTVQELLAFFNGLQIVADRCALLQFVSGMYDHLLLKRDV